MSELPRLVPRRAESLVSEALQDARVVLLNGARQAGKSTLTRVAAERRPDTLIRLLDDPATLRAAKDDPTDFVDHSSSLRRRDYLDRVVLGGFPEAVRRTPRRR